VQGFPDATEYKFTHDPEELEVDDGAQVSLQPDVGALTLHVAPEARNALQV